MVDIELIYSGDCPNVDAARTNLKSALLSLGLESKWKEWDRQAPSAPSYAKTFGSPTILVNGQDVAQGELNEADCCRLYASDSTGSTVGTPPSSMIKAAIEEFICVEQRQGNARFHWRKSLAVIPAVGAVFIPGISCPACWPAYAGLLSALGISFVNYSPYLTPLITIFLVIALFSLWYKAKTRRGYKPFIVGLVASLILILGRFVLNISSLLYFGVALLVFASIWNSLPLKKGSTCPTRVND